MGEPAAATKLLQHALKRTHATIKKRDNRGAHSKTFKAWTVSQLLEQYRDPRAILLEIASTDTRKLAEDMQASYADALAERRLCAQAVLPYVAQKLPIQVDMRHTKAIHLNIVDEAQYHELLEVAEAPAPDDGMNMQLIGQGIAQESDQAGSGTQTQGEQTGDRTPVTPPVAETAPESADQANASTSSPSHTTSGAG